MAPTRRRFTMPIRPAFMRPMTPDAVVAAATPIASPAAVVASASAGLSTGTMLAIAGGVGAVAYLASRSAKPASTASGYPAGVYPPGYNGFTKAGQFMGPPPPGSQYGAQPGAQGGSGGGGQNNTFNDWMKAITALTPLVGQAAGLAAKIAAGISPSASELAATPSADLARLVQAGKISPEEYTAALEKQQIDRDAGYAVEDAMDPFALLRDAVPVPDSDDRLGLNGQYTASELAGYTADDLNGLVGSGQISIADAQAALAFQAADRQAESDFFKFGGDTGGGNYDPNPSADGEFDWDVFGSPGATSPQGQTFASNTEGFGRLGEGASGEKLPGADDSGSSIVS